MGLGALLCSASDRFAGVADRLAHVLGIQLELGLVGRRLRIRELQGLGVVGGRRRRINTSGSDGGGRFGREGNIAEDLAANSLQVSEEKAEIGVGEQQRRQQLEALDGFGNRRSAKSGAVRTITGRLT